MKNYNNMSDSELINEINKLFHPKTKRGNVKKSFCHSFKIFNQQGYWGFSVVNSWLKWYRQDLDYSFGSYKELRDALLSFLNYIRINKINVRRLMEK